MRRTGDAVARDDWRLLVLGWGVLALAVGFGTFPFLRLREERIWVSVFATALIIASVPMSLLCRALWRRRPSWNRAAAATLAAAYVLGFCCSALATLIGNRFGYTPPHPFSWQSALGAALTAWFAFSAWSAAYFGIQHSRASERALALARDAELRALRYQINPHFLFNTLNAVSSQIARGKSGEAMHMLARLGDYFRSTLAVDGTADVLLADEIAMAEQYLDIERIRLGPRLVLQLDVAPAALPARVPHLLLLPLIENAIRHGIAPLPSGGRLAITVCRADGHVLITVANDCPTAEPAAPGIGLTNTAARLRQVYGGDYTFETRPSPAGAYEVFLRMPFR